MVLDCSHIWQDVDQKTEELITSRSILTFVIFDFGNTFHETTTKFNNFLDPFIQRYPWFQKRPVFTTFHDKGYHFIYGELNYGDNLNDEWLLLYLLLQFSLRLTSIFIHVTDSSDEEFLLVQASDVLDEWLESRASANRPWIHKGEIIIANETHHSYLTLEHVLRHLNQFHYQVNKKITDHLTDYLSSAKTYFLEYIYDIEVRLPYTKLPVFEFPSDISLAIKEAQSHDLKEVEIPNDQYLQKKIAIPFLTCSIVKRKQAELNERGINVEFFKLFNKMLISGISSLKNNSTSDKKSLTPYSREELQSELLSLGRLDNPVTVDQDNWDKLMSFDYGIEDPEEDVNGELVAQFEAFFKNQAITLKNMGDDDLDSKSDQEQESERHSSFLENIKMELGDEFSDFVEFCVNNKSNSATEGGAGKKRSLSLKMYNDDSDYRSDSSVEFDHNE